MSYANPLKHLPLLISDVVCQVEMAPSIAGPCAATLVVHATTDGGGRSKVAAVCDLCGRCDASPLHLALERGNKGTAKSDVGELHPLRLRLQNTSVRLIELLIAADEPFQTQTTALTLHPDEVHVASIELQSSQSDSVQVQQWCLTVRDKTNDNTHRLLLADDLSMAETSAHPAAYAASDNATLGKSPPVAALATSISARAAGGSKWYGLVGVRIQVQVEIYNARSQPVRLVPRLKQSGDVTTQDRSSGTTMSLVGTEPIVATPFAPCTYVATICTSQAGTHAVELQLLCTDESSVVVPLTVQVEEANWFLDGEADGLDFGTVDGHGSHFVSTQIHNRAPVPTIVRIFLDEEVGASRGAVSRCFFAALGHPGEDISAENALRLESGDRIQLPPCSGTAGSVTVYVGLHASDIVGHESLIECRGSLRVESLRHDDEKPRTASLRLHAQVGAPRLQVPGGEQLLLFCIESLTAKTSTQNLSLRNYGNIPAFCSLSTTNESFCVDPQAVVVGPSEVVEVRVTFAVELTSTDNRPEQVSDTITGHLDVTTEHMLFQIPLRAEIRTHPNLVCSAPVVNWGCVDIGATQRQSIVVRNRSNFRCEIFAAVANLDGPDLSRPSPFTIEGAEIVQLNGNAGHEFVLTFAPVDVSFVRHGLFIRDKCGRTYKIPLLGAGGKSHFTLALEHGERAIELSPDARKAARVRKTLNLRNTGTRTGFVHVDCTPMGGDVVVVGPRNAASVVVAPNKSHEFVLECSISTASVRQEATLHIYCGDELARRRRRQCRHARWSEEPGCSGNSLGRDAFDDMFCNEQFFVEPHQAGAAGAHEDTMFDDYFDEPIFEAQLNRLSVPLIIGSQEKVAQPPNPSTAATAEANPDPTNKATGTVTDAWMVSRIPLGESQVDNTRETLKSQATPEKNGRPCMHANLGLCLFPACALRPLAHQRCTLSVEKMAAAARHPECLHTHTNGLEFPPTGVGETATAQLEICNGNRREVTVVGMQHLLCPQR